MTTSNSMRGFIGLLNGSADIGQSRLFWLVAVLVLVVAAAVYVAVRSEGDDPPANAGGSSAKELRKKRAERAMEDLEDEVLGALSPDERETLRELLDRALSGAPAEQPV